MSSSSALSVLSIIFNAYMLCIINVNGDCPDTVFICPHGDKKSVGTCFEISWSFPIPATACKPCSEGVIKRESNCAGTRCGNYDARSRADGCSAWIFTGFMEHFFKDSCDMHDICYGTYGMDKDTCDNQFYQNMMRQCETQYSHEFAACFGAAHIGANVVSSDSRAMDGYTKGQAAAAETKCPPRRDLMTETLNEAESIPNGLETRFYLSFGDKFEDSLLNDQDLLNEFKSAVGKFLNGMISAITENTINYVELGHIVGFGHIDNVNQADGDKFNSILKDDAYLNIKFDVHSTDLLMLKPYLLGDEFAESMNKAIEYELKLVGKDVFGDLKVHLVDASLY